MKIRTRRPTKLPPALELPGYDPLRGVKVVTPSRATPGCCWFDAEAGNRAVEFFPECLRHIKGELGGQPLALTGWEQAIVRALFGWKTMDSKRRIVRRYRIVLIYVPRKNGKTTLGTGLMVYLLFCDGEPGAELVNAAGDFNQANLVFELAKEMIGAEPELDRRAEVFRRSIVHHESGGNWKPISAEARTKHGLNLHAALYDELHVDPDRELYDVLLTGMASRVQPVMILTTTADYSRPSICNEIYDYGCRVRDGVINDPRFLPAIYEAQPTDDWTDEKIWAQANPNYGVTISRDYLTAECQRAREQPTYENTFKRLCLNIRTEQDVRFLQMADWEACGGPTGWAKLHRDLLGRACFAGLDLSSTRDLTALVLIFRQLDHYVVLPYFFAPKDSATKREKRDHVPYLTWARQKAMELTAGNVVDYNRVRARINELAKEFNIREIAVDRWNSTQLQTDLAGDGLAVVQFGQGYASMSAPTKELEKLVVGRQIVHGSHPVLSWNAGNVSVESDAAGNYKPAKNKSAEKIDGIVALIMALGRAMLAAPLTKSVYEERGPIIV